MVKNKHLLIGVAATSFLTALICGLLLVRENRNGSELSDVQEHGTRYSQETRKLLQDLSSEIHERGTRHSQETRKNLQDLEERKISELFSELKKVIQLQKLESDRRESEANALNKRLEKEVDALYAENKRLQDELSSAIVQRKKIEDGITKQVEALNKRVEKLEPKEKPGNPP